MSQILRVVRSLHFLIGFISLALLLSGCGGGGGGNQGNGQTTDTSGTSTVATTPTPTPSSQSATITLNQTLGAKPVPANVVNERFSGLDANGAVVFGPTVRPKATQIVLTVPVTVVRLVIEYLDANNNVVFVYSQAVALTAGSNTTITDPDFTAAPGPATQVKFTTQPSAVVAGAAMSTVVVTVQDAQGNPVVTSSAAISLAIGTNPGSATLGGTTTVNASAGVASFSNLTVSTAGNGYTLVASASGLTSDTSTAFNVSGSGGGPHATALKFTVQPTTVQTAAVINPAVQVSLVDANGNTDPTATNPVTLSLGTNPTSAVLGGTLTQNAVNGVATFNNVTLDRFGTGFTLTAASAGLTSATSTAFNDLANLSFSQPTIFAAQSQAAPQILTAGDFNGDKKDDFAIVDTNQIRVFISKGDGTFQPAVAYASVGNTPVAIASGDLDGDGIIDLAVACQSSVDIYKGNANGTFNAAITVATGNANSVLKGIALGKFLNTTRLDIVVDDFFGNNSIWVYRNNGNLNFTTQNFTLNNMISGQPKAISVGDMNGDGAPDIAIACFTSTQVVALNSNSGNLATVFPNANVFNLTLAQGGGSAAQGILVGDFDLDGKDDIFCPDDTPHNSLNDGNLFINKGNAQFAAPAITNIGDDCFGVAKTDFNQDGKPDIGLATAFGLFPLSNGDFEVLIGNGNGTFQPVKVFKVGDNNARSIAIGDWNGDGLPDSVVAGGGGGWIFVNTSR